MLDRLLTQKDRFQGQYLLPKKLHTFTNKVQDKAYDTYIADLPEMEDEVSAFSS